MNMKKTIFGMTSVLAIMAAGAVTAGGMAQPTAQATVALVKVDDQSCGLKPVFGSDGTTILYYNRANPGDCDEGQGSGSSGPIGNPGPGDGGDGDDHDGGDGDDDNNNDSTKEKSDNSDANGKGGNKHDRDDKETDAQETAEDKKEN